MTATCDITITSRPVLGLTDPVDGDMVKAHFTLRSAFEAIATVTFTDKGPFAPGWLVGWVQALSFNNWAIYRGVSQAEGSALLQIGSRGAGLSTLFDSEQAGLPFVYFLDKPGLLLRGGTLPLAVTLPNGPVAASPLRLMMQDIPNFHWVYQITNGKTKAVNKLHEVRVELQYCAAVATRDPAGRFTLLGGVYWTVIWAGRFLPTDPTGPNALRPAGAGSRAEVGRIFRGAPPDARVAAVLTGSRTKTYNDLFAGDPEGDRQESEGWPAWPVRR